MDSMASERKRNIDGQISLFGLTEDEDFKAPEVMYPNIKEFVKNNLLAMEKEMTGLYLSGHPLDEYAKSLKVMTSTTIQKIYDCKEAHNEGIDHEEYSIHDEDKVVVGGIITEVTQKVTRNNQIMAFIKIEDLSATIEVIVFPKTLDRVRNLIAADAFVIIKGRVSMKEDEAVKIICETMEPLEKVDSSKVYVRVDNLDMARDTKPKLMEICNEYAGNTPLYVFTANDRKNYRMPRNMWVNLSSDIFVELEKVFGEGNVKIVE